MSGGLVLDGGWMEEEGGIKTVTFEGSCGEAFIGAHREDTYLYDVRTEGGGGYPQKQT